MFYGSNSLSFHLSRSGLSIPPEKRASKNASEIYIAETQIAFNSYGSKSMGMKLVLWCNISILSYLEKENFFLLAGMSFLLFAVEASENLLHKREQAMMIDFQFAFMGRFLVQGKRSEREVQDSIR
jgi:hypothetical protein